MPKKLPEDGHEDRPASSQIEIQGEKLLEELDTLLQSAIQKINSWLASLEGETFPIDQPSSDITMIRDVVRRAGCQLIYSDRTVQIRAVKQATSRFYTMQVRVLGDSTAGTLYAAKAFPPMHVEPHKREGEAPQE